MFACGHSRHDDYKGRTDCAKLAKEIVTGAIQPTRNGDHMGWNYGFYLADILEQQQTKHDNNKSVLLFVIRTEFLWDDWNALDLERMDAALAILSWRSPDGEQGISINAVDDDGRVGQRWI